MPIIGVDSSGHVKSPPVYFVATRKTNKGGQRVSLVSISPSGHKGYFRLAQKLKLKNWFEKVSAALIFKTIVRIYYAYDSINIDTDFRGTTREYVREYLRKLFLERFPDDSKRNNPSITFVSARTDKHVFEADVKSKKAKDIRRAPMEIQKRWKILRNPKITSELNKLI